MCLLYYSYRRLSRVIFSFFGSFFVSIMSRFLTLSPVTATVLVVHWTEFSPFRYDLIIPQFDIVVNPYLRIFWNYFQPPNATSKPTTNATTQTRAALNSSEFIIFPFMFLIILLLSALVKGHLEEKPKKNKVFLGRKSLPRKDLGRAGPPGNCVF